MSVRVYWRRGCGYCARLRFALRRAAVEFEEIDIWSDPDAAAVVRSLNHGDETVPTVVVGGCAMTNPSARLVLAEIERQRHAGLGEAR